MGTCPEFLGYKKWPSNLPIRVHMTVLPAPWFRFHCWELWSPGCPHLPFPR